MTGGNAEESAGGALGLFPGEQSRTSQPAEPLAGLREQVRQLRSELGELAAELRRSREEIGQLRSEIGRLDGDLDESRRLNLRAAELLDVVFTQLAGAPGQEAPGPRGEGT